MATTTISPNMGMPVPTVGEDPGPDWSTNVNASLSVIDSHNHSNGQGVPVSPDGLDINADLPMGNNNLTQTRSVRFTAQGSPLALAADIGCVYVSGVDLYYNDENGNQVRITQAGSVTGSSGTITGLPSGTASASYAAGTFTFQGATNTPATMAVGPLVIGRAVASSATVTLSPNVAQAVNYGVTFPAALPGTTSVMSLDTSGNIAAITTTGTGNAVLATSPVFGGVPTGTITASTYTPTVAYIKLNGNDLTLSTSSTTFYYQRIGDIVSVQGNIIVAASGFVSGISNYIFSATIPIATSSLSVAGTSASARTDITAAAVLNLISSGTTLVTVTTGSVALPLNANTSTAYIDLNFSYRVV